MSSKSWIKEASDLYRGRRIDDADINSQQQWRTNYIGNKNVNISTAFSQRSITDPNVNCRLYNPRNGNGNGNNSRGRKGSL